MRKLLKSVVDLIAFILAAPIAAHYRLWAAAMSSRRDQAFQGHSQLMALFPGATGNLLRRAFYRMTLLQCSQDCCISFGTTFATADVRIGRGVYIGPFCNIGHADIQDDTLIATSVMITSGRRQHFCSRLDIPIRLQGGENIRVTIGRDSWLGNSSVVMADIAEQSIVSAGSVVTRAAPARSILTGNPAVIVATREHRHRNPDEG